MRSASIGVSDDVWRGFHRFIQQANLIMQHISHVITEENYFIQNGIGFLPEVEILSGGFQVMMVGKIIEFGFRIY